MKIFFIISYLDSLGGTVRVANLLANQLSRHHHITLLSRQGGENAFALLDAVQDIKFSGNSWSFIRQVKQYIRANKPDVVVIHTMGKLTPILLLGGLQAKQLWSLEHIAFEFHTSLWQKLRHRLYNRLDKVICLTEADAIHYRHFHTHVAVVPNACPFPIKSVPALNNSHTIISVGRLTWQKGYDLLIDAWTKVEAKYPDWQLHIYGDGEERIALSHTIAQRRLNRIQLKGNTVNVITVYDSAAFYVMSSRYEGFGMVLVEAQSRGLPIISFDCPCGPAEIIHNNQDGFLVENGDTDKLSDKIIELIENAQMRTQFSQQALLSAQAYTTDKITRYWLNLLEPLS